MKYFFKWNGWSSSISVRATFTPREGGDRVIVHVFPDQGNDFAFLATLKEAGGNIVATSHMGVTVFQPQ